MCTCKRQLLASILILEFKSASGSGANFQGTQIESRGFQIREA